MRVGLFTFRKISVKGSLLFTWCINLWTMLIGIYKKGKGTTLWYPLTYPTLFSCWQSSNDNTRYHPLSSEYTRMSTFSSSETRYVVFELWTWISLDFQENDYLCAIILLSSIFIRCHYSLQLKALGWANCDEAKWWPTMGKRSQRQMIRWWVFGEFLVCGGNVARKFDFVSWESAVDWLLIHN